MGELPENLQNCQNHRDPGEADANGPFNELGSQLGRVRLCGAAQLSQIRLRGKA